MSRWELWEREGEGSTSFFPDWNVQARRMAEEEGITLTWEVEAKGSNPPSHALYEHLGFGEYKRHCCIDVEASYRAGWTAHREGIDDLFERVSCILARQSVTFRHYGGRRTP